MREGAFGGLLATMVVACACLLVPAGAGADASSLYQGPGQRPGPDLLYEPLADAPQLQNTGNWSAPPILVSGASAYRDGEFLYQDFLYDDSGAIGSQVQNDPRFSGNGFSRPTGTYTYPTNTVYANNAADFVELRVKPLPDATAFRITLNTLKAGGADLVATTIAIGDSLAPRPFPHGANVSAPAQLFLTVHGTTAELLDAVTGLPVGATPPSATLDTTRRQITVLVPKSSWDPTGQVVRLAAGVGLWNSATNAYRLPANNPSATQGGGASGLPNPPAFYNVAFRFNEPMPDVQSPSAVSDPAWWRENAQAHALTNGDISPFYVNVDFNKLAAQTDDDMPGQPGGVPQTGPMDRILASHYEPEQGAAFGFNGNLNGFGCTNSTTTTTGCQGWYRGQLQPYAIYVPEQPMPVGGYGLTLLLHSLDANYNQFLASNNQSQFGERGPGSIVITPEGRGPDGWYYDYAGADTFEVWADVAARYKLDPDWTAIAGYSMGGYGTYKFATQFPDLFAKAQPTVGPPGLGTWSPPSDPQPGGARSNTNRMLGSVRNVPFLMWNAAQDELVPVAGAQTQANTFDSLGYRYEFDLFNPAEHLTLAINDEFGPAATFLDTTPVDRNPPHVTYAYNPTMDFPGVHTAAGHAYWVSGVTLRNSSGTAPLGTIDVRSHGFGVGDPTPSATATGSGVLTGGASPGIPYTSQSKTWGAAPAEPVEDKLDINAQNVSTVTIDASRARVSCAAQLNITSDGPLDVNMVNCPAYPRPKGATPIHVSLTPAYGECTAPNRQHGAPLSYGSCAPPAQTSSRLTVGTPDANGQAASSIGSVVYRVTSGDVEVSASVSDVRNQGSLTDYTGELSVEQLVQITDHSNGPNGDEPATTQRSPFRFAVPCAATVATAGSTCSLTSSFNSILPGSVVAGKRAIWELGAIQVFDGGADGQAQTTGDNTLFEHQGVFVP
jgi:Putative esterase